MALKVSPVIPSSKEEDAGKENVSTARVSGVDKELGTDEIEARLGRLLGRLAAGVTLSPARAKAILDRVKISL
jgi:ribosome assembly protein YihI (activator of Der GTPase)